MNRILCILLFNILSFCSLQAQDLCADAIDLTGESGTCLDLDFDQANFDILNGTCGSSMNQANQWFQFTAEGPELGISAIHENGWDVNISLIRFTTGECDPIKFIEDTCALNSLALQDYLEEGQHYFIELHIINQTGGVVDFCFIQPDITPPPFNDEACDASAIFPDGNCFFGTTINAESDIDSINCDYQSMQSVWYTFDLSDDPYFAVQISIENISITGDIQVILGEYNQGCAQGFSFLQKYCGPPEGIVLDYNLLEPGNKYYVNVATRTEFAGDFRVCVEEQAMVDHADPCMAKPIIPNMECEVADTYFSQFDYDFVPCDYSNHMLWYTFNAGSSMEDISIDLSYIDGSEDIFLGIGTFVGNWCGNSFEFLDTYCGFVENAEVYLDNLENFKPYYVLIGSTYGFTGQYSLCSDADYSDPFINGNPCTAYEIDNASQCVGGSNEFGNISEETLCNGNEAIENWYKFELDEMGTDVVIEFNHTSSAIFQIDLGIFENGCDNSFLSMGSYCGIEEGEVISYTLPDTILMAYIRILTDADTPDNFNICANKWNVNYACFENDFCEDALDQGDISLNTDTCFTACTFGATQESSSNYYLSKYPTTWYKFHSAAAVNEIQINLSSSTSVGQYIALFENCNATKPVASSYINVYDENEITFAIAPNKNYHLAIVSVADEGGKVDVCLSGESSNFCKKQDRIVVQSTSLGSPLEGPYQKGETLNMCYELNGFSPYSESSCLWLQGIVPSFSLGWDPNSLNQIGSPNVTQAIVPISNNVFWNWKVNVHSAINNNKRRIGDCNEDGLIDLCHTSESNCQGESISSNDLLPSGWYAWNSTQSISDPDSTYGDGIFCNQQNGPWKVCFEMQIDENASQDFLEVKMHTLSDGEIGISSKANTNCSQDEPLVKKFYLQCTDPVSLELDTLTYCSGLNFSLGNVDSLNYHWIAEHNPNLLGLVSGGGGNSIHKLTNVSSDVQLAKYYIDVYDQNCRIESKEVVVEIYPPINLPLAQDTTICMGESLPMPAVVDLENNIIEDFYVDWGTASILNLPNASWSENSDETISFFIYSESGCSWSDEFSIHVENVQVGEYVVPYTICQGDSIRMSNIIDLDSYIQDSFAVDWIHPIIEDTDTAWASFQSSTIIPFVITGEAGCIYEDTLTIDVPSIPINILGDSIYCSTENVSLSAGYTYDTEHDRYWISPLDDTTHFSGISIPASTLGPGDHIFTFELITENTCPFYAYDTVHVDAFPILAFNQDTTYLGFCPGDSIALNGAVFPDYYDLVWSFQNQNLDTTSFYTQEEGWYYASAGLAHCSNQDSFYIEKYPGVINDFEFDPLICAGDSTFITSSNPNYLFAWSTDQYSSQIFVPGGDYFVTVTNVYTCKETYDMTIDEQAIPTPNFQYMEELCEGDVTQILGSIDTLQYNWSTGEDTQGIFVGGGSYQVTFFDNLMCTDSASFDIESVAFPSVQIEASAMTDTVLVTAETMNSDTCYWLIGDDVYEYNGDLELILEPGNTYDFALICSNGDCFAEDTTSIYILPVGIELEEIADIKLYPNPSNGEFYILNPNQVNVEELSVFSLDGKIISQYSNLGFQDKYAFNITTPAGLYLCHIKTDRGILIKKLFIE